MKCFTTLSVVGIIFSYAIVNAQSFTVQPGNWSSPSTWSDGIIPNSSSGIVTINHIVTIPADTTLSIDQVILNDTLIIGSGATVTLANGASADIQVIAGGLSVFGKIICLDGATISGSTSINSFFHAGSTYEHRYSTVVGEPPLASWHTTSTLEITGYISSHSFTTSPWTQSFGNVVYDCPNQAATGFVEALGNLNNIKGNLNVRNTNGGLFRLTLDRTTLNTINIGGDFIIEGRSEVWISRAANTIVNVGGSFEYRSTATASSYLTTTGTGQVNVNGDFLMNSTGLLRFASANGNGVGTLRVRGDVTMQAGRLAVLPTGIGIIECNGTAPQTFTSLVDFEPGISTVINNPSGVSVTSNSIFGDDLTIRDGSQVTFPSSTIQLQGDLLVEPGASLNSNNGTLQLSGLTNQTISLSGDTLHNITINKTSGTSVTLNTAANVLGAITIQSTDTDVISNGNLTLLSTSDDGSKDASLAMLPTGSSVLGNVTIQRHMAGEGRLYRYLSSPVKDATVASWKDDFPITGTFDNPSSGTGIRSTSPSLFYYDETLPSPQGWIPYPTTGLAESNTLVAGRGYSAYIREAIAPTVCDVTGELNEGEVDFAVTYTDTNDDNDGWNLIGNPYASPINWNALGWEKINIDDEVVVRDNGTGSFLYWDGSIGSLGSGRISTGQAFWIKTTGDNPSLKINESAKTSIPTTFYRHQQEPLDFLEVTLAHENLIDKTYLRLRSDATSGYHAGDVLKWNNDFMNLGFEKENRVLAIAAVDEINCQELPLSLHFTTTAQGSFAHSPVGTYTLTATGNGVFESAEIEVHDHYTQRTFNLSGQPYYFDITSDSTSFDHNRFSLVLSSSTLLAPTVAVNDSVLCGAATTLHVQLTTLQPNVRYSLFINETEVDTYLNGADESLLLESTADPFTEGKNTLRVKAQNACHVSSVTSSGFIFSTNLQAPIITELNGTLIGNYQTNVQWYLDHQKITGGSSQVITPQQSGLYMLEVTHDQCKASATYEFTYQDDAVHCFPNPVENTLTIVAPRGEVLKKILLLDALGKSTTEIPVIEESKQHHVLLPNLNAGIYFVVITTDLRNYTTKITKN